MRSFFFRMAPAAVLLWAMMGLNAQDFPPPLAGPLLAYTDATADAVFLYDTSTTLTRRLDLGDGDHAIWDFSPDGCQLLVTLTPPGQPSTVYSARLDGSDLRPLVDTSALPAADWDLWEPDWSPTDDIIALTLSRDVEDGRESRVGWIPATGGVPDFYSVAGDEHSPIWSPDGVWLAYISYEPRPAGATIFATAEPSQVNSAPQLREADIWIVSADGLTKERVTRLDVGSATRPRWSPDASLIGFVYSPQPGDNQFWMIAAAPEAIPTQLSFEWNQVLDLTWSPDGESMIAAVRDFGGQESAGLWSLPLIGNADIDARPYFETHPLGNEPADYPRFSPNGSQLALRVGYDLVIYDIALREETRLGVVGNTPPIWSPIGFGGEAGCG
jgi:dipeptidyl aminopeptidase/acylaminoacyl peptidase